MPLKNKEKRLEYQRQWNQANKEKCREAGRVWRFNNLDYAKKWYVDHKDEIKKQSRKNSYKRLYGITIRQFNILCNQQNGKCAICGKEIIGRDICIDHNHETGKVRGLLCRNCNLLLGHCGDNADILIKASRYLT